MCIVKIFMSVLILILFYSYVLFFVLLLFFLIYVFYVLLLYYFLCTFYLYILIIGGLAVFDVPKRRSS